MASLYGRRWRLVAGASGENAVEVTKHRIGFKIDRAHKAEANKAGIDIYNLGLDSRSRLSGALEKKLYATLEAGFEGAFPLIFHGRIARVTHKRSGTEWVTHLEAADGAKGLAAARITKTFAAGASLSDVFKGISNQLGVGLGNSLEQFQSGSFQRGMNAFVEGIAIQGTGKDVLDRMTEAAGLEYSIQNDEIIMTRPGEPQAGQAVVLEALTGMVGSPEPGEKGLLRVKALIRPGLDPPRRVQLNSEQASGLYRIDRAVYTGDSSGTDRYAGLDLRRAS